MTTVDPDPAVVERSTPPGGYKQLVGMFTGVTTFKLDGTVSPLVRLDLDHVPMIDPDAPTKRLELLLPVDTVRDLIKVLAMVIMPTALERHLVAAQQNQGGPG